MSGYGTPLRNLLIVQTGFLGDAVLATGMLRALAALRPELRIGLMVRAELGEIFEGHPAVSWIHRFAKTVRGSASSVTAEIAARAYDAALVPHRSIRSAVVTRRAGIRIRIGFDVAEGAWLLTERVRYRVSLHETARNAMLVERLLGESPEPGLQRTWLVPAKEEVEQLREMVGAAPPVLIFPGSVWATKRWKWEGFVEVARALRERGGRVLLAGSADDRDLCVRIQREAGLADSDNLAGRLGPSRLVALVSIASRVVTNDSAPLHIAESLGVPVTAVFGPTVPEFGFGPLLAESALLGVEHLECRPCRIHGSRSCPIGTHECMTRIAPERLLATIP